MILLYDALQLDFEGSDLVIDFFFWLFDRSNSEFNEQFFLEFLLLSFRRRLRSFGTHNYQKEVPMKKVCVRLFNNIENTEQLISQFLDNDQLRIQNLHDNIGDTNPEEEESVALETIFPPNVLYVGGSSDDDNQEVSDHCSTDEYGGSDDDQTTN